uniref:Uncharacterized protein n=1 Tax=Spongospora subterranea TaxID=70186 RepID=A0A0H5R9Z3_9EUKA|eukprot:CRZ05239.1 hypothetical protein [Spongospora subterranea]
MEIPSSVRDKYEFIDGNSKICVNAKYKVSHSGKLFVSAASSGNRQQSLNKAATWDNVVYTSAKLQKLPDRGDILSIKNNNRFSLCKMLLNAGKQEILSASRQLMML